MANFGAISNIEVGDIFKTRAELREVGIHAAIEAGIVGTAKDGAESIVMSGGYPDDSYDGSTLLYTGSGGRDDKTDKIIKDQTLTRWNLALAKSCDDGNPVRLVLALNPRKKALPRGGYRYEGIFFIDSYFEKIGIDGFLIWQFVLKRQQIDNIITSNTKRVSRSVQRIVRNTAMSNRVKIKYAYKCQVCGISIYTPAGAYAEGAHIRPLGEPHNGPDDELNLICLCPNHHIMLDYGMIYIDINHRVIDRVTGIQVGALTLLPGHVIDRSNLLYQRRLFSSD